MVQKLLIFLEGGAGDGCATQQHQKKIEQITKCKASRDNIDLPL